MYTDGVIEAQNREEEMFGEERLRDLLARHSDLSAADMLQAIHTELLDFVGEVAQYDDLTLLIVKGTD
jgi:phosphoserine phosphatase RsbU/P